MDVFTPIRQPVLIGSKISARAAALRLKSGLSGSFRDSLKFSFESRNLLLEVLTVHDMLDKLFIDAYVGDPNPNYSSVVVDGHEATITIVKV